METSNSLPELVVAAQETAKALEERISDLQSLMDGKQITDPQVQELSEAIVGLERVAVDIFSVFEARMQHHFKRGPFSRKLKAALLAAGHADLADRVHQHYLGVNVLKHGTGASYRELLNNKSTLLSVKPSKDAATSDALPATGLIDVTVPGFFDQLIGTILEARDFLEKK